MIGGILAGAGSVIGSLIGGDSADDAAKAQQAQLNKAITGQEQALETAQGFYDPYSQFGLNALYDYQGLMTPQGQADFYGDYYSSAPYNAMSEQARRDMMSAAEATGGLGSTSISNNLQRIAPTLAMDAYNQEMSRYRDALGIGYNAATGMAQNTLNAQSALNDLYMGTGSSQAGNELAQGNAMQGVISGISGIASSVIPGMF